MRLLHLSLTVIVAACAVPSPPPAAPAPPAAAGGAGAEREAWQRVNAARVRVGCPALAWSDVAAGVARAHSLDMVRRNYFSHVSPSGTNPGQRLTAAGIPWRRIAENIAHSPGGAADVVQMWMNSAGHRANILQCAYTHTGIGEASGRWTQVFYTPQ